MKGRPSIPVRVKNRVRRLRSSQPVQAHDDRVPRLREHVNNLSGQIRELNQRVAALEEELLDARSQGRRIGEISDLVSELLVSEASRRDPEFQRILSKYLDE